MKSYKGFNKDMTCRGYQYEEGGEYTTDKARLCIEGFHACVDPIDCLHYYAPASSVYHAVELDEVPDERDGDTKRVGKKIKIGARLSIADIVKAHFEFVRENCKNSDIGGDSSALTGGNWSALTGGDSSALTGGDRSALTGGDWSALTGGDRSALTGGDSSALTGGDWSVLQGWGESRYRGGEGAIFINRFVSDRTVVTTTAEVGKNGIKPNTWYVCKNGTFIEEE